MSSEPEDPPNPPSPAMSSTKPVHLLVLVHGMWGNPDHLAEMDRIIREQRGAEPGPNGERLHTLVAQSNKESGTYDGIDWGGERVADELLEEIKRVEEDGKETVSKLSVVGYSLGGLVSRYMVGVLHQRKFFEKVTPMNFCTVATPHIGLLRYQSFRSRMFAFLGPKLLSRTGEQFYAVDKWSAAGRPLLEVMADPDRIFYQALSLFPRVCFYANAINDMTVPYLSAAAETEDPFDNYAEKGLEVVFDDKYSPIIKTWSVPASPPPPPAKPARFSKEWFKSKEPHLPPLLQANFPYNLLIIASLPLLIPALMSIAFVRLSLESRKSRGRIRLLESDASYRERLVQIVGHVEKRVEDAVVEYMDDPGADVTRAEEPSAGSSATLAEAPQTKGEVVRASVTGISDLQRRMAESLNTLPRLEKQRAFIDLVLNSHAIIIARDVKRFKHHTRGHGVLTHLADHLVL